MTRANGAIECGLIRRTMFTYTRCSGRGCGRRRRRRCAGGRSTSTPASLRWCARGIFGSDLPKTAQASRTVELLPETVRLLRGITPAGTDSERHVFTNVRGGPIEPNSLLRHWYVCMKELGIRKRGLYATKDTYISTALTAGVNTSWLEAQTGVRYETMRRHYGKWLRAEGADQLQKIRDLAPELDPKKSPKSEVSKTSRDFECERGDLNPHGFYPTGS